MYIYAWKLQNEKDPKKNCARQSWNLTKVSSVLNFCRWQTLKKKKIMQLISRRFWKCWVWLYQIICSMFLRNGITLGSDKACLLKLWWMQWLSEIWCLENHISVLKMNLYSTWIFQTRGNSQVMRACKQHHQESAYPKCASRVPSYKSNLQCSSYYSAFILLW